MSVVLEASLGDDLAIVNAARVSYAKRSGYRWYCAECGDGSMAVNDDLGLCSCGRAMTRELYAADAGLINYLMREHHGTPFEMVQFRFRVRVPIGVGREWMRHRIGSFNETSTRYVEMEPEFYMPEETDMRSQVGKPGHYEMVPLASEHAVVARTKMWDAYKASYAVYKDLLAWGVAKELARNVLPLGLMTEFIWSVNARSLLNFVALRTAPSALLEIRNEACEVERLARTVIPVTMEAWERNGRVAP